MNQNNKPPEHYVLISEDRLLAFVAACFEKAGVEATQTAAITRCLVNADLRGVRSHGTRSAHGYALAFERRTLNPTPDIRVVHETLSTVVVDGDGALGYQPMIRAAELAVAKARHTGVGIGLTRQIGHYGSAGHYARICQEANCIGISMQGYRNEAFDRKIAPKPSAAQSGDPPMCFAIPGGEGPGMVLDMGASIFGFYTGPEYADLFDRVPGAFFKSMGLIAVSTLLGGALTGYTSPEATTLQQKWQSAQHGGMVLAIAIDQIIPEDLFRAEVERYARDLAAHYAPIPGTDRVRLPGALEAERMERYRREGIPYGEPEQQAARALGDHFGVALPWS